MQVKQPWMICLTRWGRVTHKYASLNWATFGSNNGLSPVWRQATFCTNVTILSIRRHGTFFNDIVFKVYKFSFKKMHLKMLSAKWRSFRLGPNMLNKSYKDHTNSDNVSTTKQNKTRPYAYLMVCYSNHISNHTLCISYKVPFVYQPASVSL